MVERPAKYPGSSGCRNFKDVESDLKAVRVPNYAISKGGLTEECSKSRPITKEWDSCTPVWHFFGWDIITNSGRDSDGRIWA